jgi:hypothetical protein
VPDEIEVDTDKVREMIAEEGERSVSFNRRIGLTTALLAAVAAVAALKAGSTVNEALVLKTEATRLQAQASDEWGYYQAKGIKLAVAEASGAAWAAAGRGAPAVLDSTVRRYQREQGESMSRARVLERERDAKSREADELLRRHHLFADAVALLQVAIALGAVAALTRMKPIWLGSLAAGVGGLALFLAALLR